MDTSAECSSSDLIDTNELIRLIGAALKHLGLENSVSALEAETSVQVNSPPASKLRESILSGNWEEIMQSLGEFVPLESGASHEVKCVWYALFKQRSLELMKEKNVVDAVASLRAMTGLGLNNVEAGKMAMFLLPQEQFHVPDRADLLPQLEKYLPPGDFVEKRLIELVKQALVSQIKGCKYHNMGPQKMSLFRDHKCGINHLPTKKLQTVTAHDGAICHLRFSKKGDSLASCDMNDAKVWQVCRGRLILAHVLRGPGPIAHLCWDWEGIELLTCGKGGAKRWDIVSGECLATLEKRDVSMLSCSYSNNDIILTANDNDSISEWNLQGIEIRNWTDKGTWTKNIETTFNSEVVYGSDPNTLSVFNTNSSVEELLEESSFVLFYALSSKRDKIVISLDEKKN
ncbi:hypothetical protein CASFOL_015061 [Castilleja foliolosa]|uniref:Uncharacterized protein n=1 Tax=Castilleja foliolosa TaxID=1961234 RepID=A0ABD3DCM3_9LAMI